MSKHQQERPVPAFLDRANLSFDGVSLFVRSVPMSTVPVAPVRWQTRRALVKVALLPLAVFLAAAATLWWWLPAQPSLVLPGDQKFVAFSQDSLALITARARRVADLRAEVYLGPIQSWEIRTGHVRAYTAAALGEWQEIVVSPDDRVVATQRDKELKLWEIATGRLLAKLRAEDTGWWEPDRGPYFGFSPDGSLLAYIAPVDDGHPRGFPYTTVKIWDIRQSREKATIDDVTFLSPIPFSPEGGTLAVSSQVGESPRASPVVKLWDVARAQERAVFTAYSVPDLNLSVRSLAFAPDGQTVASGTDSKSRAANLIDAPAEVALWDMAAGQLRCTIQTKQYDHVSDLQFDTSGKALVVKYGGRTLFGPIDVNELYDLAAQPPRKLHEIHGPVVLHPGRGRIAWSNESEVAMQTVGPLFGHPAADPDARIVKVTVFDVKEAKETVLCQVDGRLGDVRPLAFSPDGRDLAVRVTTTERSGSQPTALFRGERGIQLYDAATGRMEAGFGGGSDVRFAPDGTSLAILGDGPIRLYRLPAPPSLVLVFGWATIAALVALWIIWVWGARQKRRAAAAVGTGILRPTST
jgi:WD40 repeat protein